LPNSYDASLIRSLRLHGVWGALAAAVFAALLLYFNVMHLWPFVSHSDIGVFAVLLLWTMMGCSFGTVQIAYAVMHIGADRRD
jgi:hypothetical protein